MQIPLDFMHDRQAVVCVKNSFKRKVNYPQWIPYKLSNFQGKDFPCL